MEKNLEQRRDRLSKRILRERNEDKCDDAQTVLKYLEKYQQQLVGHVLVLEGRKEPFVVERTNNLLEHRFGATKQAIRRKRVCQDIWALGNPSNLLSSLLIDQVDHLAKPTVTAAIETEYQAR
jgi:hypothetical protein